MQICFDFKNFFFLKHKLHAGQILNFDRYFSKHLKYIRMTRKFFQSRIGTPWTKFLESPLEVERVKYCHQNKHNMETIFIIILMWLTINDWKNILNSYKSGNPPLNYFNKLESRLWQIVSPKKKKKVVTYILSLEEFFYCLRLKPRRIDSHVHVQHITRPRASKKEYRHMHNISYIAYTVDMSQTKCQSFLSHQNYHHF